jgi:hypothetical protein
MAADPIALIILVDLWRADTDEVTRPGSLKCAQAIEDLVNAEPRAGVYVPLHEHEEHLDHSQKWRNHKCPK